MLVVTSPAPIQLRGGDEQPALPKAAHERQDATVRSDLGTPPASPQRFTAAGNGISALQAVRAETGDASLAKKSGAAVRG